MSTILKPLENILFSEDGTQKYNMRLKDGLNIEACLLNLKYRNVPTVICISSQAGCPFKCDFCESGHRQYFRNLTSQEIINQVEYAFDQNRGLMDKRFDVTYMGIGEPLSNFNEVKKSIEQLDSNYKLLNKINISTIGPSSGIKKATDIKLKNRIHMQLSLHSPYNDERKKIFRYDLPSIDETIDSLMNFAEEQNDTPCVNYILFDSLNDTINHAKKLIEIIPKDKIYLKISQYNPVSSSKLKPSKHAQRLEFINVLKKEGLQVKTFLSHGQDIKAGCGQFVSIF